MFVLERKREFSVKVDFVFIQKHRHSTHTDRHTKSQAQTLHTRFGSAYTHEKMENYLIGKNGNGDCQAKYCSHCLEPIQTHPLLHTYTPTTPLFRLHVQFRMFFDIVGEIKNKSIIYVGDGRKGNLYDVLSVPVCVCVCTPCSL